MKKYVLALSFFVMVGFSNLFSAPGILSGLGMSPFEQAYAWVQGLTLLANQGADLADKFTSYQDKNRQLELNKKLDEERVKQEQLRTEMHNQDIKKREQETAAYYLKLYGIPAFKVTMALAVMGGMFYTLYKYLNKENKKQITK